jgi:hypothetical protein
LYPIVVGAVLGFAYWEGVSLDRIFGRWIPLTLIAGFVLWGAACAWSGLTDDARTARDRTRLTFTLVFASLVLGGWLFAVATDHTSTLLYLAVTGSLALLTLVLSATRR